jgi:chitin synthase
MFHECTLTRGTTEKHRWGTKGDTKVQTDLGVVKTTDGKVDVALPSDEKDINEAYGDAWDLLESKPPRHKLVVDAETRIQDKYKTIRTNVVLAWTLTNVRAVVSSFPSGAA